MDIEEAKALKNKALQTLKKFETVSSLQWFMDQHIPKLESLGITPIKEKQGIDVIDRGIKFRVNNNVYELIFANGHSVYTPDGGAYLGDFLLYFNDVLVFETDYDKSSDYDEFAPPKNRKILAYDFSVKSLRLDDWVEEIPQIAGKEKSRIAEEEKTQKIEKEKAEASKIKDSIDLGKYGENDSH